MADNVVHLAFKSPHVVDSSMSFVACSECKNKTFTLTEDIVGFFPLMRCAACGQHIGRMGWYCDEDG